MLGAGFVAGVCMKSLVNSGAKLSVVAGRSGQILRSMMTPVGSRMLQRWLEGRGVEVITTGRTRSALNRARAWSWTPAASMPT